MGHELGGGVPGAYERFRPGGKGPLPMGATTLGGLLPGSLALGVGAQTVYLLGPSGGEDRRERPVAEEAAAASLGLVARRARRPDEAAPQADQGEGLLREPFLDRLQERGRRDVEHGAPL